MMIPVTNNAGGTSPITPHTIFTHNPENRPKCAFANHSRTVSPVRGVQMASGGWR